MKGFVALFLFLSTVTSALAVELVIDEFPSEITTDPFKVKVSVIGAKPAINYLRVDLFSEGTSKYFGETFNGTNWYGGSDGKSYFPINITSDATISAVIDAKLGNPTTDEYAGPGTYKLKIRRYTASGSCATNDKQEVKDVIINVATPAPVVIIEEVRQEKVLDTENKILSPTPTAREQVLGDNIEYDTNQVAPPTPGKSDSPVLGKVEDNFKTESQQIESKLDNKYSLSSIYLSTLGLLSLVASCVSLIKIKNDQKNSPKNT